MLDSESSSDLMPANEGGSSTSTGETITVVLAEASFSEAENNPEKEADFPSLCLGYQIAIDSYDMLVKRIDGMDGRIQSMLAFAATTTAVVPTVAKGAGLSFRSYWLYLSLLAFVVQLVIGFYARNHAGTVQLLNPKNIFEDWISKEKWVFRKEMVWFAGVDFAANNALLEKRWRLNVWLTVLFFIEVAFLLTWVALATRLGTS